MLKPSDKTTANSERRIGIFGLNPIAFELVSVEGETEEEKIAEDDKKALSSETRLSSLSVSGYSLNPVFDSKTYSYDIVVPKETQQINISAVPVDNGAKVTGTGNLKIDTFPQTYNIVVTAPNGDRATYSVAIKEPTMILLMDLDISAKCSLKPEFDPKEHNYTIVVPAGTKSLDVSALIDENVYKDAKVTIDGASTLSKSKNVVRVSIESADGGINIYEITALFDDEPIVVEKHQQVVKDSTQNNKQTQGNIILPIVLSFVVAIVFFLLGEKVGKRRKKVKDYNYIEEDSEEYTILDK